MTVIIMSMQSQAEFEKHVQAVQKRRALLRLQNRRFMARIKPNQGWREERPPPVPLNKRTLAGFMNMEEAQEGQAIPPDATTTPPPSLSLPKNAKVDRRWVLREVVEEEMIIRKSDDTFDIVLPSPSLSLCVAVAADHP